MTVSTKNTVIWQNRSYFGGDRIGITPDGSFIIDLFTTPPDIHRGTYFTSIPISTLSYRSKHKTLCGVRDDGHKFISYATTDISIV
jgi:hypothetical protein